MADCLFERLHAGFGADLYQLGLQLVDQSINGLVSNCHHLFVGSVLNGVFNEESVWLESEGVPLCLSCVYKHSAGNEHSGDTSTFQISNVMHTA